jgi:hypothetical protein
MRRPHEHYAFEAATLLALSQQAAPELLNAWIKFSLKYVKGIFVIAGNSLPPRTAER